MQNDPTQKTNSILNWISLSIAVFASLALTARLFANNFQKLLSSDYLIAHIFTKDLLYGSYPIDAWKFGSATFIFPDYFIYTPLVLIFGDSGTTFFIYGIINILLLGVACGYAIHCFTPTKKTESLTLGYLFLSLVLFIQFIPHHDFNLYRLLLPAYHGSTQILGILLISVLAGAYCKQRPLSKPECVLSIAFGSLGVFSNTLLFTQFLIPWLVVLLVLDLREAEPKKGAFWQQAKVIVSILGIAIALKAIMAGLNIWEHARLFREYPTPFAIWRTLQIFLSDFRVSIGPKMWAFWLMYLFLISISIKPLLLKKESKTTISPALIICVFTILSVFISVALPIVSIYWKNFQNTRYFLNLLVLPGLAATIWGISRVRTQATFNRWFLLAVSSVALFFAATYSYENIRYKENFVFEYPERVREFDKIVADNQLSLGLCDYWHRNTYNQMSKSDAYLNQVRKDGTPYFWCNNVYWYYGEKRSAHSEGLVFPDYEFVLLNGLDETEIRRNYGEPAKIINGKHNIVFIYKNQNARIHSTLAKPIADWLAGKRLNVSHEF